MNIYYCLRPFFFLLLDFGNCSFKDMFSGKLVFNEIIGLNKLDI